jgi:hypothetical protein
MAAADIYRNEDMLQLIIAGQRKMQLIYAGRRF